MISADNLLYTFCRNYIEYKNILKNGFLAPKWAGKVVSLVILSQILENNSSLWALAGILAFYSERSSEIK